MKSATPGWTDLQEFGKNLTGVSVMRMDEEVWFWVADEQPHGLLGLDETRRLIRFLEQLAGEIEAIEGEGGPL